MSNTFDSIFVPKKKKQNTINDSYAAAAAATERGNIITSSGKKQTIIIVNSEQDNDRERRRDMLKTTEMRLHTHFQSLEQHIFINNINVSCQLGSYLYLDATTILQYCYYWVGEYSNRTLTESEWFPDILDGILKNLPTIEISGQYGLKYTKDNNATYCNLFKFVGTDLHRIPHAHFIARKDFSISDRENAPVLKGFAYILNALNKCFLTTYAPGLKSEFLVDNFIYNTIMEEFFEPSFIILTCFMQLLQYINNSFLYNLCVNKTINKDDVEYIKLDLHQKKIDILLNTCIKPLENFISKHEYLFKYNRTETDPPTNTSSSLLLENSNEQEEEFSKIIDQEEKKIDIEKSLEEKIEESINEYKCIDRNDINGMDKRIRLLNDLTFIVTSIKENFTNCYKIQKLIEDKWLDKSNYCSSQMSIRTKNILNHLKNSMNK